MAEKIVLEAEVKSNIGKQAQETKEWGDSIKDVSKDLGFQKKILADMEKDLIALEKQQSKSSDWENSINNTTKKLKEQKLEIKDQKLAIKTMTEEQKTSTAEAKKAADAQKEQKKAVDDSIGSFTLFGVSLNGIKSAFGKIIPAAKAMFGSIKAGLISTGVGAFVVLIGSLVSYFTNTKRGADALKKGLAGLGAAVSVITDLFSRVGETMVGAFRNPKQAILDLWDALKKNLLNRLDGAIEAFGALGKVIKSAVSLDWDGVTEGASEYGKALIKVGTGMDEAQQKNFVDGVKNIVKEVKEEVKAMTALEGRLQKLRDAENAFMIQKAETRQEIEKARLVAEDETKTAEERLNNLKKALKLEEQTTQQELELAREKVAIQAEQMALSENLVEDEEKLAQLKVALIEKETASVKMRRRVVTEVNALEREIQAEKKALAAEAQAAIDKKDAEDALAVKKKQDEAAVLLALQQENTLALIEDLEERALAELKILEDKEIAKAELMENSEEMLTAIKKKYERKRGEVAKQFSKDEVKWSEMTEDQKLNIASSTAGNLSKIMGEETAAGKAMAITQATIDTYRGATAAYASMAGLGPAGPALGAIAAAAAIAAGLANVKAIMSASSSGPSGGGGGGGPSITPDAAAPSPQMMSGAFELGAGEAPEPTRAYVITDEMSSSQDQLANIRRRATI